MYCRGRLNPSVPRGDSEARPGLHYTLRAHCPVHPHVIKGPESNFYRYSSVLPNKIITVWSLARLWSNFSGQGPEGGSQGFLQSQC